MPSFNRLHFVEFTHRHVRIPTHLSEQASLYVVHSIRFFAMSLLGIFLPIYVYEITQSLLWVILFFLVWSVAILVFLEILGKTLFSKISLKNILILSLGLLMVKYYFLLEGRYNEIFLLYAGILGGIVTVMYWVPYDTLFTRKFKDGTKHFGRENSKNDILLKLSGALAPLLGGAIITLYGFSWLFT